MKKIVGIAGQMQNGKDTLADYLASKLKYNINYEDDSFLSYLWSRGSFASEVKRIFSETFNVSLEFIEEWKVKAECPPGFDMPIRKGLQFIGDGFRKIQGNIWIDLAIRNIKSPTVISDCRYLNELDAISNSKGVCVLIWRPGKENDDPNGSESQIRPLVDWFAQTGLEGNVVAELRDRGLQDDIPSDCAKVDLFIKNDGTKEDLFAKADSLVIPYIKQKLNT